MANYSCECVEASHIFAHYSPNSPERMYRVRAKQGGEFGKFSKFLSQVVLYTKKIFLCIKRSSLPSPNSPNSPNLLNTRQIRRSESQKFAQYSPNLPMRVTKIWRVTCFCEFEYSPKTANIWRVLKFAKFAGEWPLLTF